MYTMNSALQRAINRQRTLDYCMYMMLSSYFKGSICKNTFLEKRLYLYYKEQKADNQVEMEKQCIRVIEQEILPRIPKECLECRVQIRMTQKDDRKPTILTLYGKGFRLQVSVTDAAGRNHTPGLVMHYHPENAKYLTV